MSTLISQLPKPLNPIQLLNPIFLPSPTSQLITLMAQILSELTQETAKNCVLSPCAFNCRTPPKISLRKYLERFEVYAQGSEECFLLALIYLDRISETNRDFVITPLNIHRLLVTSFVVAVKFFDEEFFPNSFYAKIGGITLEELNRLEAEFLRLIDFKLFVDEELFNKYKDRMLECEQ